MSTARRRSTREFVCEICTRVTSRSLRAKRRIVIFSEHTAGGGADSEELEIIAGNQLSPDYFGLRARIHTRIDAVSAHDSAEDLVVIVQILEHRIGQRIHALVASVVPSRTHQYRQPVRILHRKPSQDELLHQSENRGIRSDAERK